MTYLKKTLLLSTMTVMLLASACSDNGNEGTNGAEGSKASPSDKPAGTSAPDPLAPMAEKVKFTTIISTNPDPKFPEGQSYEDNDFLKYFEDKLNVDADVIWTANNDGNVFGNKLNLAIASGEIPDIFTISDVQFGYDARIVLERLAKAGMIEDMTQVYADYASEDVKGRYGANGDLALDYATFDGKLMALPNQVDMTQQMLVWVRQDWLEKYDLPEPTTVDNLMAVAQGFVDKGKMGLAVQKDIMSINGGMHTLDSLFSAYRAYPRNWLKAEDGSLVYGGIDPNMKDALAKANEMYASGLINKEFAIIDAGKTTEFLTAGDAGLMFQPWWAPMWPLAEVVKNDPEAQWKAYALVDASGVLNAPADKPVNEYIVVKKGFEHPEIAMKFMNYSVLAKQNKIREIVDLRLSDAWKDSNVKDSWALSITPAHTDTTAQSYARMKAVFDGSAKEDTLDDSEKLIYTQIKADMDNPKKDMTNWQNNTAWMSGIGAVASVPGEVVFSEFNGQTESMKTKWGTLYDLQMQTYVKIIMGEEPIGYFDQFVEQWKKLGGDDITKEVNASGTAK